MYHVILLHVHVTLIIFVMAWYAYYFTTLFSLIPPVIWFGEILVQIEKNLKGCYKLKSLQAVDMFPHTPHIECVCLLELCWSLEVIMFVSNL